MKKLGILIAFVLLFSIVATSLACVSAQETVPGLGEAPLMNETQAAQQQYEQYTAAENKSAYLSQEWTKLLEKHKILGPAFKVINSIFVFLSPFFKIVLGYESSLSWGFIFALIIWFALFFFIYPIMSQILNNSLTGGLSSFAVVSLIGLSGAIKTAVEMINIFITDTLMFWITLAVMLILSFVFSLFGKQIKSWIKKKKQQTQEEVTEMAQERIQAHGEISKEALESLGK